jgi:hypothetical protein
MKNYNLEMDYFEKISGNYNKVMCFNKPLENLLLL